MSADLKYQYEQTRSDNTNLENINSYSARDLINIFTQINGNTVTYVVPKDGTLNTINGINTQYAVRGQLNFNPDLAQRVNCSP